MENSNSEQINSGIARRSFDFGVKIIELVKSFNRSTAEFVIINQLVRSGTSIGANIQEAQSAHSRKDFIHKMEIALKEARETKYWILISIESKLLRSDKLSEFLVKEIEEIIKILVTIVKTSKSNSDSKV